jgi:hypothetical protein
MIYITRSSNASMMNLILVFALTSHHAADAAFAPHHLLVHMPYNYASSVTSFPDVPPCLAARSLWEMDENVQGITMGVDSTKDFQHETEGSKNGR